MENNLEAEIAHLAQQLEEKKKLLAGSQETKEDHEVVREYVTKEVYGPQSPVNDDDDDDQPVAATPVPMPKPKKVKDYLDSLDRESAAQVNNLISLVSEKGFTAAITEAKNGEPFILDAFHDALVGKLYHELKDRGLVK